MKAKCKHCGDTVEVTRPRVFKSCKCGAIALDYGDEYYYRVCGAPEDFDGEVEDVPEMLDRDVDIIPEPRFIDNPMERAMGIIGEENIGGESRPMERVPREIVPEEKNEKIIETEPTTKCNELRIVYVVEETCQESYNLGAMNIHSTIFSTENAAKKYLKDRFREIKKASESYDGYEASAEFIEGNRFEYSYVIKTNWHRGRLIFKDYTGVILKYTLYGEDENGN